MVALSLWKVVRCWDLFLMNGSLVITEGSTSLRFCCSVEVHLFAVMSTKYILKFTGIILPFLSLVGRHYLFWYPLSDFVVHSYLLVTIILHSLSLIFELTMLWILSWELPQQSPFFSSQVIYFPGHVFLLFPLLLFTAPMVSCVPLDLFNCSHNHKHCMVS